MLRSLSLMTAVLMAGSVAVPAAACDGAGLRTRLVGLLSPKTDLAMLVVTVK